MRWQYPVFMLSVILCADRAATHPDTFGEAEIGRAVPLAAESRRLRTLIGRLADCLAEGYHARALQRVPHLVLLDDHFYEVSLRSTPTTAPLLAVFWLCPPTLACRARGE